MLGASKVTIAKTPVHASKGGCGGCGLGIKRGGVLVIQHLHDEQGAYETSFLFCSEDCHASWLSFLLSDDSEETEPAESLATESP